MARRASSSFNPAWILTAALVLAAAIAGGWLLYRHVSDPFRTLTPMDVPAYLDDANSLRGNVYKISGTIDAALAWSPGNGRLISVATDDGKSDMLPLLVPSEFNALNIQKGQRYFFKIEVGEKGILRARDIQKK